MKIHPLIVGILTIPFLPIILTVLFTYVISVVIYELGRGMINAYENFKS
jgi:hypothetical protein